MNILFIRLFLFCLVPIGIIVFFKGIKLFRKAFNGEVILDLPYNDRVGYFTVKKEGVYSIWHKGELLKKTPITKFRPYVIDVLTHKQIKINSSIMSPRSNNFSTGRMELFTFYAEIGDYQLELVAGSSVSGWQKLLEKAIPLADMDLKNYFIEVRKSQAQFVTILSIPIMLLGCAGILGGLVLGLLAKQIFM